MFEETARIPKSFRTQETAQEQVRQLMQATGEMVELLRQQQDALRARAMSLPPNTLDNVRRARQKLETLMTRMVGAQSELRQLRGLAETTALITSSLDTLDVLNQVIDRVVQLTGAERGYVMLRNEATGALEFRVARGMDQASLNESDFIISDTIVNQVATTGEPVLTHNALNDPQFRSQESVVGFSLRSILAVPLIARDQIIGVVYCDNRIRAGLFQEHELNLLTAFAHQAAVAIQNARLFESLRTRLVEITQMRDLMDNVFTSIASGLITLNRDDVITAYNHAAETITGVPMSEALGKPLSVVLPVLDGDFTEKLNSARGLPPQEQIEVDLVLDAPARRYWKVKLSALRDAEGQGEGVAMVLDDLTAATEDEARLNEAERYMPVALDRIRGLDTTNVGGQERTISVLFADVRGFTSFSERLEPETLMQIINQYLTRASDAIDLYDGVVDKYMGDAVTGLFNTQLNAQDDHALRAVRAAMSILYDVRELHASLPDEWRLHFGIGVHTGLAVLGSIGGADRREFSAIGDAIDLCKLLQENAERGEILLSEATYALVRDHVEAELLPPRKIKDRRDFTAMYRLVGLKRRATGMLGQG